MDVLSKLWPKKKVDPIAELEAEGRQLARDLKEIMETSIANMQKTTQQLDAMADHVTALNKLGSEGRLDKTAEGSFIQEVMKIDRERIDLARLYDDILPLEERYVDFLKQSAQSPVSADLLVSLQWVHNRLGILTTACIQHRDTIHDRIEHLVERMKGARETDGAVNVRKSVPSLQRLKF